MTQKTTRSILLIITYTVLLILFLMKFDWIWGMVMRFVGAMKPFFIGFAIAFALNRPCQFFRRFYGRQLGRRGEKLALPLAVVSSYLGVILVVFALVSFVLPQVADSISLFVTRLEGYIANLQIWANDLFEYFHAEEILAGIDFAGLDDYLKKLLNGMLAVASGTMGSILAFTGSVMSVVVTLVLSLVFSIYMLAGRDTLLSQCRKLLYAYVPRAWAEHIHEVVRLSGVTFTNFVSGQLLEACILGALCAAGMLFIQPDYAPLIGVIIGISALIPVAGAYVGAVLSAFLLMMVSPVRALVFLVFLVVLQQIEGNVIYPRVVGTSIGLPGLWVLTAVTVGGGLFGLLGIMLSVPVCSVLYTLLRRDAAYRIRLQEETGEEE